MTELLASPILVGLIIGLPSSYLGIKAFRRTERLDRVAAVAAAAQQQSTSTQLIIDGLNSIIENLREDNRLLREQLAKA